ncbi:MAG: endonuclease MutS2 [Spirochaetota bacterium]
MSTCHIDNHTLEELQFATILQELQSFCFSPEGRASFARVTFVDNEQDLEHARDLIAELLYVFSVRSHTAVQQVQDIHDSLQSARKEGSRLDGEQLWDIYLYISTASQLPAMFLLEDDEQPKLESLLGGLPDLHHLSGKLAEYLSEPGVIREEHPRVKRLIDAVRREKAERSRLIARYTHGDADALQSQQAAVRDGRLVLPVKAKDKQHIPGVLHTSSHSGNTLFIEPYDLVEKNNAVATAEQEVTREIDAIFRELTSEVAVFLEDINTLSAKAGEFDTYYAKARYAVTHSCTRADTADKGIVLRQARHPLLRDKAVPLDIAIDEHIRVIVMSGPNAGGKTVTLKTVAFLVLMNQLGMYIPAAEGSQLPVFSSVWSDIGDEQSIELELSTFSGHLNRISTILNTIDDKALVLLDELGTGTDPIEGAALAQAILEYCRTRAAVTLVTSHHAVLKQYAYTRDDVSNAAMDFDERAHSPTFRVIFGEAGESRALETAMRLDMPEEIISQAKELLGDEMLDMSHLMKQLQTREQQLREAEERQAQKERELTERIRQLDLQQLQLRQQSNQQKRGDLTHLQKFITEARSQLEQTIRTLREHGELTKKQIKDAHALIDQFENKEQEVSHTIQDEEKRLSKTRATDKPVSYTTGEQVRVGSTKQDGYIVRQEKQDRFVVRLNTGMKLTVSADQLEPAKGKSQKSDQVHVFVDSQQTSPSSTIDVRGMSLSEAIGAVERQIDAAVLAGLDQFAIIHGKGEGVLQTGIHSMLSDKKEIQHVSFARPEDGGYGKTIVQLS